MERNNISDSEAEVTFHTEDIREGLQLMIKKRRERDLAWRKTLDWTEVVAGRFYPDIIERESEVTYCLTVRTNNQTLSIEPIYFDSLPE